jgi:predicted transcriptional regulator
MANTYTISLPDELKGIADELANRRQLSIIIAGLLKEWYAVQAKKNKGT